MKNIEVTNFKGTTYSGSWNGKSYSSKIEGREDLNRIYVNSEPIHITDEELKRLQGEDENRQKRIAMNKVNDFFDWLEEQSEETKKQMFMKALDMMAENSKRSKTSDSINTLRGYFYNN